MYLIYVVYTRLDAKRSSVQGNLLSEMKTQKIVYSVVLFTAKKITNTVKPGFNHIVMYCSVILRVDKRSYTEI